MKPIRILLVEDDADDIQLLQEALQNNNVNYDMEVVMEGDKVLPHLTQTKILPHIIVMDFNLPKLHGREILRLIRKSEHYSKVPVVVLTTSSSPHDVKFAQDNGADKFITKPSTIKGFNFTVETIVNVAGPIPTEL